MAKARGILADISMSISKATRQAVYAKYGGHCAYCGRKIELKDMQVDHFIPQRMESAVIEGNYPGLKSINDLKNLMPACRTCNHYKRAHSIEVFRQYIQEIPHKLRANYIYKIGVIYGNVVECEKPIRFYYEMMSENEKERSMNIMKTQSPKASTTAQTVYVYKEYCDEDAYGEEVINVFWTREAAVAHLKKRVEECFSDYYPGVTFDTLRKRLLEAGDLSDADTIQEDYVSYGSEPTSYWIVEEVPVEQEDSVSESVHNCDCDCVFASNGVCKYANVHDVPPHIHETLGCIDRVSKAGW